MALAIHYDACFVAPPWVPSLLGFYLVKDLMIFAAALVIGGTVVDEDWPELAPANQDDQTSAN